MSVYRYKQTNYVGTIILLASKSYECYNTLMIKLFSRVSLVKYFADCRVAISSRIRVSGLAGIFYILRFSLSYLSITNSTLYIT